MSSLDYIKSLSGTFEYDPITKLWLGERQIQNLKGDVINMKTIGKRDFLGRWHGDVLIKKISLTGESQVVTTEEVTMYGGRRHGLATTTKRDGSKVDVYYNMGEVVGGKKIEKKDILKYSAYQFLDYNYPWYINTLNLIGFTDQYIEAYLDTIETVMSTYVFNESEFDDYYSDASDLLNETHYKDINDYNMLLTLVRYTDLLRSSEFHMIAMCQYISKDEGTYDIIRLRHPRYLQYLNDNGANNIDVEGFCTEYDKLLESYGSLDQNDPLFADSVFFRSLRALETISELAKSSVATSTLKSVDITSLGKNGLKDYSFVSPNLIREILDASPKDVTSLVFNSYQEHYLDAEMIMRSVWKSYVLSKGIVVLPTVSTELAKNKTSTTINGYVLEDGGADVSSRGIAWATTYNPTIDNDSKGIGAGIGDFSFEITGLTEGTTYFARAFATNSKGTKYGNCITFEAGSSLGIDDNEISKLDFTIYPNPA
ncbi:MAG: hypothetical protein KAH32_07485, partial [Chlamydiia bacterium]|nr:hypothetical protein [Chlamydiia bacterium]